MTVIQEGVREISCFSLKVQSRHFLQASPSLETSLHAAKPPSAPTQTLLLRHPKSQKAPLIEAQMFYFSQLFSHCYFSFSLLHSDIFTLLFNLLGFTLLCLFHIFLTFCVQSVMKRKSFLTVTDVSYPCFLCRGKCNIMCHMIAIPKIMLHFVCHSHQLKIFEF